MISLNLIPSYKKEGLKFKKLYSTVKILLFLLILFISIISIILLIIMYPYTGQSYLVDMV